MWCVGIDPSGVGNAGEHRERSPLRGGRADARPPLPDARASRHSPALPVTRAPITPSSEGVVLNCGRDAARGAPTAADGVTLRSAQRLGTITPWRFLVARSGTVCLFAVRYWKSEHHQVLPGRADNRADRHTAIEGHEAAVMMYGERQQIRIGELPGAVQTRSIDT